MCATTRRRSAKSRIDEIHEQTASLTLLVNIVAVCVLVFGVVTVISVLLDSTNRKRSTLGIMRVMGVSRRVSSSPFSSGQRSLPCWLRASPSYLDL